MNVSATDLATGTFGLLNPASTAQHLGTVPALPVRPELEPPDGFDTWQEAYESTFIK
jgi:hypothetical protein